MATILVIDDEKEVCQCCEDLFSTAMEPDINVLKADNGPDGLALYEKYRPDIVLIDLQLQAAMDGVTVIKRIKQAGSGTKVVVFSGFIDDEEERTVRELGVDACLIKPATPYEILSLIKKLLRQNETGW